MSKDSTKKSIAAQDMLPVEQALKRILELCDVLPSETKDIRDCTGQVLAVDVVAPFEIPPHDNTAMDGYAVQSSDTNGASYENPVFLNTVGELAAGYLYQGRVGPGEAVRIMTGAPIPPGADSIVPFEETDEEGLRAPGQQTTQNRVIGVLKAASPGANIRYRGEDVQQGKVILTAGTLLRGPQIAVLASLGVPAVDVVRRPIVAILSTGDELLTPGEELVAGKIFDSNAYGLSALTTEYGGIPRHLGIARDTIEALTEKIHKAIISSDLVVTSAGVSRGDFDVVKEVLANEGSIDFWTVRMKPGKPLAFGQFNSPNGRKIPHIGLPGNPVSSLLAFELFGRPVLHKMLGCEPQKRPMVRAIADEPIINTDGRRVYARALMSFEDDGQWHARLTGPQGSGVLTSMALASGFAICPENVKSIEEGQEVDVLMIGWDHQLA